MVWHGAGSLSSPIVISDEDDDAYVEMQLEDRLSDAVFQGDYDDGQDLYEEQYQWEEDRGLEPPSMRHSMDFYPDTTWLEEEQEEQEVAQLATFKRKRSDSVEDLSQPESKRARKKRLRKEALQRKKARKAQRVSTEIPPDPGPPQTASPVASSSTQDVVPLPPKPYPFVPYPEHLDPPPPPPMYPTPVQLPPMFVPPMPMPTSYNPHMDFTMPLPPQPMYLPPPLPMHLPPLPLPAHLPPRPPSPLPSLTRAPRDTLPLPSKRGPIGMPPPGSENKGARYVAFEKSLSPPADPSRTLIMTDLPRKFRTREFVIQWAAGLDKANGSKSARSSPRIELDARTGRTLIEFKTAQMARAAWHSPRLPAGDGKEHIRVWWYQEIEEGEIGEEGEIIPIPPPLAKKEKPKSVAKVQAPASSFAPPPSSLPTTVPKQPIRIQLPPPPAPRPQPPSLTTPSRPTVPLHIESPTKLTKATLPSAVSTAFSLVGEESMDLGSDDGIIDDAEILVAPVLPYSSGSKAAESTSTIVGADTSMASQASSVSTAVSSPVLLSVPVDAGLPTDKVIAAPIKEAETLLAKQTELEERISQAKTDLAKKAASSVPPKTDPPPNAVTTPIDVQSVENALRQKLLEGMRRRKVSQSPAQTAQQLPAVPAPKPVPPAAGPAGTSSLNALAVTFISQTIQTATATSSVKTSTPPALFAKMSEKDILAARQRDLQQLISNSKALMDKFQAASTKSDKEAIMAEIRGSRRAIDEAMKLISQPIPKAVLKPVSPWPQPTPNQYILMISDTEDEDDMDDDGDL